MKFTQTALIGARSVLIAICLATSSARADSETDRLVFEGIDELKAQNLDAAIEKFNQAIAKDPKERSAYNNRGLAYTDKKEFQKAIADFNEVLRLKRDWSAYFNRGIAYYEKGEADRAIADASKALQLKPGELWQRADCFNSSRPRLFRQGKRSSDFERPECGHQTGSKATRRLRVARNRP
jgi:tetratricopeptide (TPR) repeat protein